MSYTFFSLNRKKYKSRSGGIGVFVKIFLVNDLHIIHWDSKNVLWFYLSSKYVGKRVLFGAIYIPPEGLDYSNIDIFDYICLIKLIK